MATSFMELHGKALRDGGFAIVPIAPRSKAPSRWNGRDYTGMNQWERYKTQQPDAIVRSWGMWPDCGIGIVCGTVVAVDLDIDAPELQDQAYAIVNRRLGATPAVRIGRPPRRLLVYRTGHVFRKMRVGKAKGAQVEILADGQQFVAYGIHPEGHEYHWVGDQLSDLRVEELPEVTHQQLWDTLQELKGILPEAEEPSQAQSHQAGPAGPLEGTLEAVTSAMEAIPNDDLSWDDWNRVGMALFNATSGAGWPEFERWSARSAKNDPVKTKERWGSYFRSPPTSIGAGTIYHLAEQRGWKCEPGVIMNAEVAKAQEGDEVIFGNYDPKRPPRGAKPVEPPGPDDTSPVAGVVFNGDMPPAAIPYLVSGVVPKFGVGCIAGESTAGKTFAEVLLAVCVASETDFVGNPIKERTGALIIAGEGCDTLNNRIIACQSMVCAEKGALPIAHTKPLKRIQTSRDLQAEIPRVLAVKEEFEKRFGEVRLGVIFFDTIAASFFVEDENDANDAQVCVDLMRELGDATGCVVIALHHYNKSGSIRGSSAFTAAFDFIITAERGDREKENERRTLHLRKDRNGKERQLATYTIESYGLGEDAAGEPFNAGYLHADPVILRSGKLGAAAAKGEEEEGPDPTVDAFIKAIAMAKMKGNKQFSNRQQLVEETGVSDWKARVALKKMKDEKLIFSKNDKYFLTPAGQKYFDEAVD